MRHQLRNLLRPEHLILNLEARDAQDAINKMVAALVRTGHVEPEFAADVWQREQMFPTGLPTQPLASALPHADPQHVRQTAVAIGVLKNPVRFGQMGTDGSISLDVHVIILLAIKEREKQVELIRQTIELLQFPGILEQLVAVENPEQALQALYLVLDSVKTKN